MGPGILAALPTSANAYTGIGVPDVSSGYQLTSRASSWRVSTPFAMRPARERLSFATAVASARRGAACALDVCVSWPARAEGHAIDDSVSDTTTAIAGLLRSVMTSSPLMTFPQESYGLP